MKSYVSIKYKINMYSDSNDPFERKSDNVEALHINDKEGKYNLMDKKFGINIWFFIVFAIIYALIHNKLKLLIGEYITLGLLFTIIGAWGLGINELLLKLFYFEKYKKVINIILVTLGTLLIIYGLIKILIN